MRELTAALLLVTAKMASSAWLWPGGCNLGAQNAAHDLSSSGKPEKSTAAAAYHLPRRGVPRVRRHVTREARVLAPVQVQSLVRNGLSAEKALRVLQTSIVSCLPTHPRGFRSISKFVYGH